jgi:hypothetical protein
LRVLCCQTKPTLLAAVAVEVAVGHAQQILAADQHAASRRAIQPAEDVHQRGFAAAAGADNRHQLARLHAQVEFAQRHLLQPGDFIDFDETVTQNEWL